jgi:ABC-type polysaccharide/polyol phosphate transport system ATPase subunit
MTTPRIRLDRVTKTYRRTPFRWQSFKGALLKGELRRTFREAMEFTALEGLSLQIEAGETFGVIGPNGAGKSTLLKLVAGILSPTRGTIHVDGAVAALIELGAGFHPEMAGRENVIINGMLFGLKRREILERLPAILEFADLGDFVDEPVKAYSSGMQARLGFAVAVHVGAPILLVDEILSVGDEAFSRKCLTRIQRLQQEGTTFLIVSHDLDMVARVCHRAAWLEHGVLKLCGPPQEVVQRYRASLAAPEPQERPEPMRFGDRRVVLERVSMDAGGPHALSGSDDLAFLLRYRNVSAEPDVVFGIGIFTPDGKLVYGTNTAIDGARLTPLPTAGEVRFKLPGCPLVEGPYVVDAAVHSSSGAPYDYWRQCLAFEVRSGLKDVGGVRPPHTWEVTAPEK